MSSEAYQKQRDKDFNRPFLDKNLKIVTTINSMKKLNQDVWFLQEVDDKAKEEFRNLN